MTSHQPGVQPGADPNPKRTRARAAIVLAIVLAVLGYLWWQRPQPAAPKSAPAVMAAAQAASAPASAASASAQEVAPVAKATVEPKTYTVKSGDTLGKRFGKNWKAVCDLNEELLKGNCNHLEIGWVLKLPEGVEPLEDEALSAKKVAKKAAAPAVLKKQELSCIKLGASPFNPDHVPARAIEGIELLETLPADKKEVAKRKFLAGNKLTEKELVGAQTFKEMLYQSKVSGKVIHIFDKAICDPNQGGVPEVMDTYDLGDGYILAIPRRCGNVSWFFRPEAPKLAPLPPREPEPPIAPEPPASAPEPTLTPPPALPPVEQQVAARYDDWDLGFYAGGDRDVVYTGGEGAYYPGEGIFWRNWGRYAVGVGAFGNLWDGQTPQDYSFGGRYGAIGLSQKWSTYERRDLGIKFPMIGAFSEYGHDSTGKYRESRHAKILCASASYNDASREKAGETSIPEWQLWTSLCDPISQSKSHSWDGQALNTADMKDIRHIVSVGGRVFLTKDLTGLLGSDSAAGKKLQPFVEVGANKTSPFPYSAHAYLGLRTVDKVWGCGVGPHYSDATNTTIAGFTCTYDAGRHYKLGVEQERWTAMVKSLEALGVNVADD